MKNVMKRISDVGYILFFTLTITNAMDLDKDEVDKVIEDEITQKLSDDLLQSIERKFQVDLEKSVDSVLLKIKSLLQNGTTQIQENLLELQSLLENMKRQSGAELDTCLMQKQAATSALAEKALHQMVVCGYALIGHDPAQAVQNVLALKTMIKQGLKPINEQKTEVYNLLKVCGHDHDSLKKVIKCVISKSPLLKSSMMGITGKLIEGVVHLTKLMAHGAMHEACLIEVIKTVEEEAFDLVNQVKICIHGNQTFTDDVQNYIKDNNATVLDIKNEEEKNVKSDAETTKQDVDSKKNDNVSNMKDLIRRMLSENNGQNLDRKFKEQFLKLQKDLGSEANTINNDIVNDDE